MSREDLDTEKQVPLIYYGLKNAKGREEGERKDHLSRSKLYRLLLKSIYSFKSAHNDFLKLPEVIRPKADSMYTHSA